MTKTVLAFGYHDQQSPRHHSVVNALAKEGSTVIECHTDQKGFLRKCTDLVRQYHQHKKRANAVLVTFPGHYLVPLAWLLTRFPRKRLLFDAFISLHDTLVSDRALVSRAHPKAWFLWTLDWLSCHLADDVIVDTEEHRKFFAKEFHLPSDRIRVIYLEARHDLFERPSNEQRATSNDVFEVFFYGSYIPLQGVEHILHAAKIIQGKDAKIHFTLVGSGQRKNAMLALADGLGLTNVTFVPFVSLQELAERMRASHLCLGIFGTSDKAARVIPHKVYDAVAAGIPVITRSSPAILERFADHPGVILCKAGDAEELANKILETRKSA